MSPARHDTPEGPPRGVVARAYAWVVAGPAAALIAAALITAAVLATL